MSGKSLSLRVDGYEVLATFADTPNRTITHHLKQILMASFVNKTSRLPLATSLQQSQNGDTIKTVIITVHLENCIEFVWMHLPFDCINQ